FKRIRRMKDLGIEDARNKELKDSEPSPSVSRSRGKNSPGSGGTSSAFPAADQARFCRGPSGLSRRETRPFALFFPGASFGTICVSPHPRKLIPQCYRISNYPYEQQTSYRYSWRHRSGRTEIHPDVGAPPLV